MLKSPFVRADADGNIIGYHSADDKSPTEMMRYFQSLRDGTISATSSEIASHATGGTIEGMLSDEDAGDLIAVNLTAGQTYTWSYRGTAEDGITDPWLRLIGPDETTVITEDDDGGFGRTSQITFTATETDTYYLHATSWYQIDPAAPAFQDNGDYTIAQWSPQAGHDAGTTPGTAGTIEVGTNYGYLEVDNDIDLYAVELTAGMYYTFTYNGGVGSSGGVAEAVDPGESIGVMGLQNSAGGTVIPLSVNSGGELGISFLAQASGTYYLTARSGDFAGFGPAVQTGGYTIDVSEVNPADHDPLEALNWDSANNITPVMVDGVPTAYVYFAPAGMHFGETADDGVTHMTTYGWTQKEMDAVMLALEQYTPVTGINYVITNNPANATFRLLTTTSNDYGAYFYPQDPDVYGTQQGIGVFNIDNAGWDRLGVSSQDIPGDQVGLDQGGFNFATILHEFGHAHGIAHPHDTGGGSEVMLGVSGPTGSLGIYSLNQGVYTVMSYNDAWQLHPDGASPLFIETVDNGWSGTLSAFDIAVLQARYGVHEHNQGDSVYALTDVIDDAFYQTIWDSGGDDTIAYSGALNAQIDLTAATLDYSPTGGGVVSFLHNPVGTASHLEVKGGFTIANGVLIENATGGTGNDILIGNDADNVLDGGDGSDTAVYALADSAVTIDVAAGMATGGGGNDTLVSIENAVGSKFDDTLTGSAADNLFDGGAGDDVMSGDVGTDTVSYKTAAGGVTVDLGVATAQNTGGGGVDTLSGFENVTGSSFNDNLTGTNDNNLINGGSGSDVMSGLGGIDTVTYIDAIGAVSVLLSTATGQNTVSSGTDTLSGFENLTGSNFNDTLGGTNGDNVLDGAFGVDRVTYVAAAAGVFVNLSLTGAQATIGAGNDTLISFENLTGSDHNDVLIGNTGANDIVGGSGNDAVSGGDGNDVLTGGTGDDSVDGGAGIDTASYSNAAGAVTVSLAAAGPQATVNAGLDTLSAIENLTGSNFDDTLIGDGSANVINAGTGNDTVDAGGGNDTVNGGAGNDTITAGEGNDTVNGEAGNDTVNAGAGNDTVNGGDGNDTVNGDAGNDTLTGGIGDDFMNGGVGNDRIVGDAGVDTVRGGDGIDVVTLGAGDDVFMAEITATKTKLSSGTMSVDIITDFDAAGNDWIDLSELGTFNFGGNKANNKAGDLTYKTYATVAAAENVLGFDIDGRPGAGGVAGPVTVVYGNTDGKAPDFAIVLLNTAGVGADDFAPPPSAAAAAMDMLLTMQSNDQGGYAQYGDYIV